MNTYSMRSPPDGEEIVSTVDGRVASRRPNVFSVDARAVPIPWGDSPIIGRETDVALLETPGSDELFDIRAPRGALVSAACSLFAVPARRTRTRSSCAPST